MSATTYMQKFLANSAGFSTNQSTQISAAALFVFMLAQPLMGYLSDRFGRKLMLGIAFGGLAIVTWPLMNGIATSGSALVATGLITGALLIQAGYTSISAVVKAELFPTHARGPSACRCPTPSPMRCSAAPPNTSPCGSSSRAWNSVSTIRVRDAGHQFPDRAARCAIPAATVLLLKTEPGPVYGGGPATAPRKPALSAACVTSPDATTSATKARA